MDKRALLYNLLGDLPPRDRPMQVRVLSVEDHGTYTLEKLEMDVNGLELVPAVFIKPKNVTGKIPAILYNHPHGNKYDHGKKEFFIARNDNLSWADQIIGMGYAALCMDMWCFGERNTRTELETFKEMLWKGQSLWGMMVYDTLRGFDYLLSCDDIDTSRIGTLGLSMGSTMAWWVAALETRIKLCADICCLSDFEELIKTDALKYHGIYYYVPSLIKHFSSAHINALIAPRAHISVAGDLDPLTPPAGLERIDEALKYAYADKPEHWKLLRWADVGHKEIPAMRQEIISFLKEFL
ncbi:MAG: alpha/beta hydrolase [Alphaproteobacteria bacterium]|nr:alpha/beta hydrolase [Alphaproteobacteria bacterium]